MDKKMVVQNGVEVAEGWPQRIDEAQHQPTYFIGGKRYDRVRYGHLAVAADGYAEFSGHAQRVRSAALEGSAA